MSTEPLVIADTSVLIAFERLGHLELLPRLFPTLAAPVSVVEEFGVSLPWLSVLETSASIVTFSESLLLDRGEAEAIALAVENPGAVLLLDDRRARKVAEGLGQVVVGTAGSLVHAKRIGLIVQVKPLLDSLRRQGFRISDHVYERSLALADELGT